MLLLSLRSCEYLQEQNEMTLMCARVCVCVSWDSGKEEKLHRKEEMRNQVECHKCAGKGRDK